MGVDVVTPPGLSVLGARLGAEEGVCEREERAEAAIKIVVVKKWWVAGSPHRPAVRSI